MHLPRMARRAALAVRQELSALSGSAMPSGYTMPSTYCSPICPNCKKDIEVFSVAASCVSNSSFITNCGACQQCIITYVIEQQSTNVADGVQGLMEEVLNMCLNTTVSDEIIALESQASRLSLVGDYLMSKTSTQSLTSTTARPHTITAAPTFTTGQGAEVSTTPAAATSTSTSTTTPPQNTAMNQPLNQSWIVGPVIGSVLGIATVAIVIYFTRRKQKRDMEAMIMEKMEKNPKDLEEDDSGDSTHGKPQLHSESVPARELETHEVYELPAVEPVGSELTTPREGVMEPFEEWPLPITPLRAMFAMTEIRDERAGNNNSPKHDTYYHS